MNCFVVLFLNVSFGNLVLDVVGRIQVFLSPYAIGSILIQTKSKINLCFSKSGRLMQLRTTIASKQPIGHEANVIIAVQL